MELTWTAPPPAKFGSRYAARLNEIVDALKARPGDWALLGASKQTSGLGSASLRKRGCKIAVRTRPDGQYDIYARWVGDAS